MSLAVEACKRVIARWTPRTWLAGAALAASCLVLPLEAAAQQPQQRPDRQRPAPGTDASPDNPVSPAEIQRLFDAYAALQAQQQLELTDEQYGRLLPRIKALQDVRRRHTMQRGRIIQQLRRLTAAMPPDEARLRASMKELADIDARGVEEIRTAQEGVDQVLDVVQQARFRVFEEQMERRKMELMLRARQGQGGGRGGPR